MLKGTVKLYSIVKGAGVIIGEDKKEYSVKIDGIKGTGFKKLSEGQKVEFEVKEGPKGLKAVEVTVI